MRIRWPWILLPACGPAAAPPPSPSGPNTSVSSASGSSTGPASGGPSVAASESASTAPVASYVTAPNASGAGIYTITWGSKPLVRMTIGLHSRRVHAVSVGPSKS